jgi:hypothetical protein
VGPSGFNPFARRPEGVLQLSNQFDMTIFVPSNFVMKKLTLSL